MQTKGDGAMNEAAFRICQGKGFHIRFENGYTVSVQFGPGNYCENRYTRIGDEDEQAGRKGSINAECALIDPAGELVYRDEWGGEVSAYSTPAEVLALMNEAANMDSGETECNLDAQ